MSILRTLTIAALLSSPIALIGCNTEGGRGYSSDSYTYVSRTWSPKTVTLLDSRTGETLWSVDLPVGKQMTVGFRKGTGPNEYKPDMMYWGMTEPGRVGRVQKNWIPVPPHHGRRLELTLRDAPEAPGITLPGTPFDPSVDNLASRAESPDAPTEPFFAEDVPTPSDNPPADEPTDAEDETLDLPEEDPADEPAQN